MVIYHPALSLLFRYYWITQGFLWGCVMGFAPQGFSVCALRRSSGFSVCVRMWAPVRVRVCVCVCMCVYSNFSILPNFFTKKVSFVRFWHF